MWGACVDVYQLLNWKMHGETLKKKIVTRVNYLLPWVSNKYKYAYFLYGKWIKWRLEL